MTIALSDRQRQIALLVAEGLREKEIAERLGIAQSTVKAHKQTIYAKLGTRNAVEMARALAQ